MKDVKFLIDVGVGKKVESYLIKEDFDVLLIRDIDVRLKDIEILRIAAIEERTVVTMDKDFGELIYNSGKKHSGVLLLRLEDAKGDEKENVIKEIIQNYVSDLKNNFCVYQNAKFRIKRK